VAPPDDRKRMQRASATIFRVRSPGVRPYSSRFTVTAIVCAQGAPPAKEAAAVRSGIRGSLRSSTLGSPDWGSGHPVAGSSSARLALTGLRPSPTRPRAGAG
jgi:hypothetical protein